MNITYLLLWVIIYPIAMQFIDIQDKNILNIVYEKKERKDIIKYRAAIYFAIGAILLFFSISDYVKDLL